MDEATSKAIKKSLQIPEEELLTIWRIPGYRDCPLGDPDMGVTNCSMGFDTDRWSPNNPPLWMKERLSEDTLIHCRYCQGHPKIPLEQIQVWSKVYEILTKGGDK